jgi:hypothetical protein
MYINRKSQDNYRKHPITWKGLLIGQFWHHIADSPDAALHNSCIICWQLSKDIRSFSSLKWCLLFLFFFTSHTKCIQIWYQVYLNNHLTMSNSSHTTWTPKEMKKHTDAVKGYHPDNPNDTTFKLVTILVFLLCQKNTPPPFLITARQWFPPPPQLFNNQLFSPPDVSCLQKYRTNVLCGVPDQGQTLDVWESQTAESALRWSCHCMWRGHHLSLGSISWIPQDIPVEISADIFDYTYWNQGKI